MAESRDYKSGQYFLLNLQQQSQTAVKPLLIVPSFPASSFIRMFSVAIVALALAVVQAPFSELNSMNSEAHKGMPLIFFL